MFRFAPGFRDTGDSEEEAGLAVCPELTRAMEGVKYIAEVTRIMEDSNKVTADSRQPRHRVPSTVAGYSVLCCCKC